MFSIIIDFEATSVDPKQARPIEVGLLLVDSKTWEPIMGFSQLIYEPDYATLPQEIEEITTITQDLLFAKGLPLARALEDFENLIVQHMDKIEYIIAYNKAYDEVLFKTECRRTGASLTKLGNIMSTVPWLCAMRDVEKNYKHKCWKLSHLALDHGVAVDPNGLHRAMADVTLTRKMLEKVGTTAADMFVFQDIPWVTMQALIPAPFQDGGKGRDLAVKAGYSWERPRGTEEKYSKAWVKKVKEHLVEKETSSVPFKVQQIGG